MKRTAVIMAGGSGERFWPLSRKRKPKQLLRLASDRMMIEESIERINPVIPPEDIFIITGEHLLEPIRNALPMLPPENVVAEPHKRNTAPCLALAAAFIAERYSDNYKPDEISIAVLTADQSISPVEGFLSTVKKALEYVEKNLVLATIGIQPSRPETGYGYIEVDKPFEAGEEPIKPVIRFHEKPGVDTAGKYLQAGNYFWNSGMFFWRLDTFSSALTKCLPEVGEKIPDMQQNYAGKTKEAKTSALESVAAIFGNFPNTSIDYGLMEKAENVVVCRAEFNWDDIGSWDSLERVRSTDESGNIISGDAVIFDTSDSVIFNETIRDKKIVSAFGLDNVVIVVTDDAVLVCPKDRVQEVKRSVETIRDKYGNDWL